jgi:hypothetical protein
MNCNKINTLRVYDDKEYYTNHHKNCRPQIYRTDIKVFLAYSNSLVGATTAWRQPTGHKSTIKPNWNHLTIVKSVSNLMAKENGENTLLISVARNMMTF